MTAARKTARFAGQRLATLTGIAALLAVVLPSGRSAGALRWWWQGDPVSVLGGVAALLAMIVLLIASFSERPRGPGIVGTALALGAAATWALVAPASAAAVLVVITALAVSGCVIEVALPAPRAVPSTTRLGWTLGAAIATIAVAVLSIMDLTTGRVPLVVSIGAGGAGALALLWTIVPARARERVALLPMLAIGAALITAVAIVVAPIVGSARIEAVAAARIAMLLVTAIAALAAILVGGQDSARHFSARASTHGLSA